MAVYQDHNRYTNRSHTAAIGQVRLTYVCVEGFRSWLRLLPRHFIVSEPLWSSYGVYINLLSDKRSTAAVWHQPCVRWTGPGSRLISGHSLGRRVVCFEGCARMREHTDDLSDDSCTCLLYKACGAPIGWTFFSSLATSYQSRIFFALRREDTTTWCDGDNLKVLNLPKSSLPRRAALCSVDGDGLAASVWHVCMRESVRAAFVGRCHNAVRWITDQVSTALRH